MRVNTTLHKDLNEERKEKVRKQSQDKDKEIKNQIKMDRTPEKGDQEKGEEAFFITIEDSISKVTAVSWWKS